jgi:hypothetical protein
MKQQPLAPAILPISRWNEPGISGAFHKEEKRGKTKWQINGAYQPVSLRTRIL